jgi:hypothetical protein
MKKKINSKIEFVKVYIVNKMFAKIILFLSGSKLIYKLINHVQCTKIYFMVGILFCCI